MPSAFCPRGILSGSLQTAITSHPSAERACAIAPPMPREAPVTSAVPLAALWPFMRTLLLERIDQRRECLHGLVVVFRGMTAGHHVPSVEREHSLGMQECGVLIQYRPAVDDLRHRPRSCQGDTV